MSFTEAVTTIQGQVLEGLTTIQAPVVDAIAKATEAIDGALPGERPDVLAALSLPEPAALVELGFTFAQKLLDNQHDFAKAIVAAMSSEVTAAPKVAAKPRVAKAA
ncbi:MAG: hypothetical protein ACR2LQ_08305 [Acidimicrobiales bacterium]